MRTLAIIAVVVIASALLAWSYARGWWGMKWNDE